MIPRSPNRNASAYDHHWEDIPNSGPVQKWFGGVILPLFLIGYGIACIVARHAEMGDQGHRLELTGPRAFAYGIAAGSMGTFLHCHYFWGNIYHLSAYAVIGKIISLMAFIGGLGYLIVQVGVFGRP
ncbi:MAG: putative rane protein [Phycisphaerales bacterium]|nr:putative rane protein [Phycisphaerales bacterium]